MPFGKWLDDQITEAILNLDPGPRDTVSVHLVHDECCNVHGDPEECTCAPEIVITLVRSVFAIFGDEEPEASEKWDVR